LYFIDIFSFLFSHGTLLAMDKFKSLFGIDRDAIQKTVVLLPFIPAGVLELLGIKKLSSGALFASASTHNITVIRTGTGASFVGDAVLKVT